MAGIRPGSDRIDRRSFLKTTGAGAALVGLAGCAGDGGGDGDDTTTTEETTTTTETMEVKMGGTLIASFGADVKNFDPVQQNDTTSTKAFERIYETLMATDFDGKPQPYLAKSVEKVDDVTFTATLREGIMFHNGNELMADDVKATFDRYEGTPREGDVFDWYESSTVTGDYTIEISLQEKYAPFKFALGGVPIVPKEVADGDLSLKDNPVGTGPYKFVEHQPDELFRMERYDDHWFAGNDTMPETPPIEQVDFRVITEQSAQQGALEGGDIDFSNAFPAGSISDFQDDENYLVKGKVEGGFDMFIYPSHPEADTPWQNRHVRLGTNRLIPRESIIQSVYDGIGIPAYSPISPLAAQFTSEEFNQQMGEQYSAYDPEAAAEELEQGFDEAGFDIPYQGTIITNQNPQRVKWSQLIQESMNSTEYFEMELNQFEWNTYVGKILAEDSHTSPELVSLGWSAGWDPDAYVNNLFSSQKYTPACCNINHFSNDTIDELVQEGLRTYALEDRQEIYKELQEEIVKQSPMAFIQFGKGFDVMAADVVKNWEKYPIDGAEYTGLYAPYDGEQFAWVDK